MNSSSIYYLYLDSGILFKNGIHVWHEYIKLKPPFRKGREALFCIQILGEGKRKVHEYELFKNMFVVIIFVDVVCLILCSLLLKIQAICILRLTKCYLGKFKVIVIKKLYGLIQILFCIISTLESFVFIKLIFFLKYITFAMSFHKNVINVDFSLIILYGNHQLHSLCSLFHYFSLDTLL